MRVWGAATNHEQKYMSIWLTLVPTYTIQYGCHILKSEKEDTLFSQCPNPSAVCMLRRHIVLLIAICPPDGDVKPGGPLGAFWEEQAMSRHRVSPSPFLSSSSHTTHLHYTNSYTYSHRNFNFLQHCTDTLHTRNVVCPSGALFKNRPHLTPFICLVWNPKRVIVQWVGIRTDRQTSNHG